MVQPLAPTSFARQPLDVILSRAASVRVLRALLTHGGPLPVTRIAFESQMTPGGVRSALDELVSCGLVEVLGSGRAQLYRVPEMHPLRDGFAQLFRAEIARWEHAQSLAVSVAEAKSGRSLVALWLFGSVARGTDMAQSDLDLALILDAQSPELEKIADGAREMLADTLGLLGYHPSLISMSIDDFHHMIVEDSQLWQSIRRDGKSLHGPTPALLYHRLILERADTH